jgi:hypothetical protein
MFVSLVITVIGLCLIPMNARAEIKELIIGIGIDADTLLPYDQTIVFSTRIRKVNFILDWPQNMRSRMTV